MSGSPEPESRRTVVQSGGPGSLARGGGGCRRYRQEQLKNSARRLRPRAGFTLPAAVAFLGAPRPAGPLEGSGSHPRPNLAHAESRSPPLPHHRSREVLRPSHPGRPPHRRKLFFTASSPPGYYVCCVNKIMDGGIRWPSRARPATGRTWNRAGRHPLTVPPEGVRLEPVDVTEPSRPGGHKPQRYETRRRGQNRLPRRSQPPKLVRADQEYRLLLRRRCPASGHRRRTRLGATRMPSPSRAQPKRQLRVLELGVSMSRRPLLKEVG